MANVVDIIVLDDEDGEEEGGPLFSRTEDSPPETPSLPPPSPSPPPSKPNGSEKKDGGSSQKGSMSAENQKLFEEFVDYCSRLTDEHPEVIAFLQSRFSKASPKYLSSVEFRNTLGRCLSRVQDKQKKVYVYINELCTVLKAHTEKKKVVLQKQAAAPQSSQLDTEPPKENAKEEEEEEVQERKAGSKHQIRRLENLLRLYSQEIQKLQEKELTLEEMEDEDSTYIQESRLKQKMLRIFDKLCELKDCSSLTGRVIEQRIQYQGTRYKEVNRRLEKFINKTRDIFPDYSDVFKVVQKANERHTLGLTRKHMQSIAQDAFRELGNKLQHRRHLDMVYNFGCHLTDSYKSVHDPAEHDNSLSRRLRENRSLAENRLEDVIKKYAVMQDEVEVEDWKNKEKDDEMPSTSKAIENSPRSRKTRSPKSEESEEDDDDDDEEEEEEEEEESEESDVDIEEELRQSQEAADGEEDEEAAVDYLTETDQMMEETSQNASLASKEDGEKEETNNSDPEGEDSEKDGDPEGEDSEKDGDPEGEDSEKDGDQEASSGSKFSEKEDLNTSMESGLEAIGSSSSPDHSNDSQPAESHQDGAEDDECSVTSETTENTDANPTGALEMSVVDEPVVENEADEIANVPNVEAKTPSSKEQGTATCADTETSSPTGSETPVGKTKKEGRLNRLDKCISKITGSLVKTKQTSPVAGERGRSVTSTPGGSPSTEEQSSNGKLVCVDAPSESWDSVRKVAFSHGQSTDDNADVVRLDSCRDRAASNGVHRAVVRSASPTNHIKLDKANKPTDSLLTVKVEGLHTNKRKRTSSRLWTPNGMAQHNGEENSNPKLKRLKHSSSYTSYSSPSELCSDNEPDITLGLILTCSPQVAKKKTSPNHSRTDAATQCDPDEVIVLSD